MVVVKSKLLIRLYVVVSVKCRAYSLVNHEVGTRAHPMFLSVLEKYYVIASVEIVYVCAVCLSDVEFLRIYKVS